MKKIGIMLVCMLLVVTCIGCQNKGNNNNQEEKNNIIEQDGKKINKSTGVISLKEVEGFSFEATRLVTKDNDSTFVTYMTNKNKEPIKVNKVNVVMKNKEGKEVANININLNRTLEVNKTIELSSIISLDLTSVYDINYIIDYSK